MNNSINYGNFLSLFIKNNDSETCSFTSNPINHIANGEKMHMDRKQNQELITGLQKWLNE